MRTISMTELNQRVSAVTREVVEKGESIQVTKRGTVVMLLVPAGRATDDPLEALIRAGLATPPTRPHRPFATRERIELSADIDQILDEINRDVEI